MLKEERVFRLRLKKLCGIANCDPRPILRELTWVVKAVREDDAKVVEGCGNDELYEAISDAVRKGKPVQQCTYCGLMKENITSNGECRTCRAAHI